MVNRVFKCSLLGCARLCVHMDIMTLQGQIMILQGQMILSWCILVLSVFVVTY